MGRKSVITKELIIEATLECFVKYGFEETTFRHISTKLKLSQPALYKYFDNKMDLLAACSLVSAEKGRALIDAQINPKDNATKRFHQYLQANFCFFKTESKEALAITSMYFFGQSNKSMREIYESIQLKSIDRFEAMLLQISYETGKKMKNSYQLAELIQSLMVGEVFKHIFLGKKNPDFDRTNLIMKQIYILVQNSMM